MSWEGHEEMGRGAIFANYDDARKEDKLNEVSYSNQSVTCFCLWDARLTSVCGELY